MKHSRVHINSVPFSIQCIITILLCQQNQGASGHFEKCTGQLLSEQICLTENYQKANMPSKPLLVNMSLVIPNKRGIRMVDDEKMTITLDLHIMMYWFDNRIITNFTKEEKCEKSLMTNNPEENFNL